MSDENGRAGQAQRELPFQVIQLAGNCSEGT